MRVLTYGLSTDKFGGIETFVLNMNKFMPEDIVFDYIIEANAGIPMGAQDTIHRAAVEERGGRILFVAPKKDMINNIRDWHRLLRKEKENSDVVYFNMYSLAWFVPVIIAKLHGFRVFVHAHNNNLHDCGKAQKLMHGIFRQVQKCMKIVRLTNSPLSTRFFFNDSKAEMIYNAIDTNRFRFDESTRKAIREQWNVLDKHVYGFVGRIAYQKNPLFLMEIFAEIKKKDNQAVFLVCGAGDLIGETRARATELNIDVCFAGVQSGVEEYYSAMDVFILPSRFEGLGLVLVEAQCSGLPCVTSADVVPIEAKVTDLLDYISLDSGAEAWAELAVKKRVQRSDNRQIYAELVGNSNFEIRNEGPRLGRMLCGNR